MDDINKRIKYYRRKKGYTQGELAKAIGMKSSTYSQAEREGIITCDLLLKVAKALEVDPEILLLGKKEVKIVVAKPRNKVQPEPEKIKSNDPNRFEMDLSLKEKNIVMILRQYNQEQRNAVYEFITEIEKTKQ